jgi:hypothetical protein
MSCNTMSHALCLHTHVAFRESRPQQTEMLLYFKELNQHARLDTVWSGHYCARDFGGGTLFKAQWLGGNERNGESASISDPGAG